jgi:hypothetical protein
VVHAALGSKPPQVSLLGFTASLGGLSQAALFLGITLVSLVGATILVWTTSVSAISPLLRRFVRWGRAVRLPVANGSAAIALGLRMAPMLLDDSRTSVNLRNGAGQTAAMFAALFGKQGVIEKLAARGADLTVADAAGQTAQKLALQQGNAALAQHIGELAAH